MSDEFDNVVWEYKLFDKKGLISEHSFNELGKQGWEFVAFNEFDGIFKRRKPSWSVEEIFEE
jgi:hypothetical protein